MPEGRAGTWCPGRRQRGWSGSQGSAQEVRLEERAVSQARLQGPMGRLQDLDSVLGVLESRGGL